jgi:colicin import membrane protein
LNYSKENQMKKNFMRYAISGIALVFLFTGCSKAPTQEMNAAKTSVDALMTEGADKYAPEDAKKVNDEVTAAMDEVKAQDSKLLKNYSKAKEMLAKAQADADSLKSGLAAKKEEAKKNAASALEAAKSSVDNANALLAKAPKGKGSKADIEALKSDVKGLEDSLPDVQKSIDGEDYVAAAQQANTIKEKADSVSEQVNQALAKVKTASAKAPKAHAKKKKRS